ncbi:uncharacterized protein A1O5_10785 [Cladophialophora psammophila CBS 110553]|uniref:NAD-dependent epimerase/dehydratase domain-containing protein n=1 Tax=Cladophialophora psammophila CBS 110553 TaxID=1182543 RepID=W9X6U0_9EURO|nr:uncharacterized protein A1O5_10785 [Cladophialophora psammophila CBS 110553]EXJ66169.1 hypothetical protein A1O5_10785 [Cladophialophora psammophila CBS 110553]
MPRVLLTGTNGFIGSHILDTLLSHGVSVRGLVRSDQKARQVALDHPQAGSQLDFAIVPDMTAPNAFDEALISDPPFDAVIHTASPLSYTAGKTLADFIEPAVRGTMEILEGVNRVAPSVRRVVVTGSFAAIGNPKDMQGNGKVYTSQDWNPITEEEVSSAEPRLAYWVSKTLAEKVSWKFMQTQKPHYDLVVLNPPMVYGPLRHSVTSIEDVNVSNYNIWRDFLNSTKSSSIPKEWVHADIDVRDLAEAHYRAAFTLKGGNKRYLIARGRISNQEIADILRKYFPEAHDRIPIGQPGTQSFPDNAFDIDGDEAKRDLDLTYRSYDETFKDLGRQLLDIGTSGTKI